MTILEPNSVEFISHSADQTRRVGMRLGAMLRKGNLLCLTGNLGAGKTTFVQGLASGWGSLEQVTSPTFVLINQYRPLNGDGLIYHLDAYRLQSGFEAEELDLDTMLDTGILIIEWPERIVDVLPPERLWVELEYISDEKRRFVFKPAGKYYEDMVEQFARVAFGGRI